MGDINNKSTYGFIEENFNIKLLPYQKILLNILSAKSKISNGCDFYNIRHNTKKLDNYILLVKYALFMKDDEIVTIASPKEIKKMNREELFNWLQNKYWQ